MMKRQMTNSLVQSCHPVICDGRTLFDSRRLPDHDLQGFVISPFVIRYLASYYLLSRLFYWLSRPLDIVISLLLFIISPLVIRYLTSCYFLSCLLLFAISLLLLIIMPLVIHYLSFYYSLSCHLTSCYLLSHLFSFVISLYCYSLSHLSLFVIFNWPCLVRACTKDNVEPTQLIRRQWFVKCSSLAYFERSVPLANRGRTLQSVFSCNV